MADSNMQTTSGNDETTDNRLSSWQTRWQENNIRFHQLDINPSLIKYIGHLTQDVLDLCFLVPLCGKSLDMAWLYKTGHRVIGVEGIEQAILEFFQEQNLEFSIKKVGKMYGCSLYQSLDGRLKIYHCDFFKFVDCCCFNLGQVDCVFDRGSLVAINKQDRPLYAKIIKSLLGSGFRYLLQTVEYEYEDVPSHVTPKSVSMEEVESLFHDFCKIEILHECPEFRFNSGSVFGDRPIVSRSILLTDKVLH